MGIHLGEPPKSPTLPRERPGPRRMPTVLSRTRLVFLMVVAQVCVCAATWLLARSEAFVPAVVFLTLGLGAWCLLFHAIAR